MGPVMSRWLEASELEAYRATLRGDSLSALSASELTITRNIIPYLNQKEAAYLRDASVLYFRKIRKLFSEMQDVSAKESRFADEITRPFMVRDIEHAANVMDKHLQFKAKAQRLNSGMNQGRASGTVFWLCSWHQTPAEKHKEFQGRVLYDRYWRQTLRKFGMAEKIPVLEGIIRDWDIPSVQDVTNGEPYLITRPYCRHYLVPVTVLEVMKAGSEKEIMSAHPEAKMPNHRTMTKEQQLKAYRKRRADVRRRMKQKT